MTDTLMGVSPPGPAGAGDAEERELNPAELAAVEDLVRRARTAGIALTGPDGLLKAMTKTVISAPSATMSAPVQAPTAAEHQSVAAVLRPRTFSPSFMMTPAPRKPMPDTT